MIFKTGRGEQETDLMACGYWSSIWEMEKEDQGFEVILDTGDCLINTAWQSAKWLIEKGVCCF